MKDIILLNEITPTKGNIDIVSDALVRRVKDGEFNPLEFAVKAKWLSEVLNKALKDIKEETLTEVQKYGKEAVFMGAKVEAAETGTKYDYTMDENWKSISEQLKPLQEELKAQEERIKMATKLGNDMVDTYTGEIVAKRVVKTSETSTKITLGK